MLSDFFNPATCSLKICGLTRAFDIAQMIIMGVDAVGINFWPQSKRYLDPAQCDFLKSFAGQITRIGVFVNAGTELPRRLFDAGMIDVVQLHGDEPEGDLRALHAAGLPLIRASTLEKATAELTGLLEELGAAILLDAVAPDEYGGTGRAIDWAAAGKFVESHPHVPVILAGGLTPENAAEAVSRVRPCAIDVASGAESAPGVKDLGKVRALRKAVPHASC